MLKARMARASGLCWPKSPKGLQRVSVAVKEETKRPTPCCSEGRPRRAPRGPARGGCRDPSRACTPTRRAGSRGPSGTVLVLVSSGEGSGHLGLGRLPFMALPTGVIHEREVLGQPTANATGQEVVHVPVVVA